MNIRCRLILPLVPLALAAVSTAQEDPSRSSPASSARAVAGQPPIVTMSFPGGTLSSFVDALRRAEPRCNIVVAEDAAGAELPAMELKSAGLDQVLESACAVAGSESRIGCSESRGSGEPVFAIIARSPKGATVSQGQRSSAETMVLSLNRLTQGDARFGVPGLRVPTILSAIETGTSFDDKAPMLRYHEDSGLLFLRGSRRQLALAHEVLQILERDLGDRVKSASLKEREQGGASQGQKKSR